MKTFPMFLQMAGHRVVIAGGGEQAAQKTRLMLKTEARIHVLADDLEPELQALADSGRITQQRGAVTPNHFADAALVFVATGCPGLDAALHDLAKVAGALVNVVDQPGLCDAITPSIVDRDPVVVAIGTEGTAPVLARQIKTKVEQMLEPRLGDLASLAGRLRGFAAMRLPPRARRDLWRWVFSGPPREAHGRGAEREAADLIKAAIDAGGIDTAKGGSVSLVGAGPGSADLITLRGVQRLQEADIIFYDRLVAADVLELARRDAERVHVGKMPGCHSWPQEKISAHIVAAAQRGLRVVRLKCGDPGIFARSTEEIDALEAAGVPFEIVPGVTAACGAAAALNQPLTSRSEIDTLVLTTGHTVTGEAVPVWLEHLRPGSCVAFYMGTRAASMMDAALKAHPERHRMDIRVVHHAQGEAERQITARPGELSTVLAEEGITDTAMILISLAHETKATPAKAHPHLRAVEVA
ncbi:MAG: siroheme synthase CysG [Roseobacter sp.]